MEILYSNKAYREYYIAANTNCKRYWWNILDNILENSDFIIESANDKKKNTNGCRWTKCQISIKV